MLLTAPIRHHILAHSNHADAAALARLADRGPIDLTAAHPAADAGQALLLEQLTPDIVGRIAQDADHLELLTALDLGSVLVVPLADRTRIPAPSPWPATSPAATPQADLTLAQNLARRTAAAIEHADRAHHPTHPHQPPSRS